MTALAGFTAELYRPASSALVADLTPRAAAGLRHAAGIKGLTADVPVQAQSLGFDPATQGGSMTNITRLTGAQTMWKKGYTGAEVSWLLEDNELVIGAVRLWGGRHYKTYRIYEKSIG